MFFPLVIFAGAASSAKNSSDTLLVVEAAISEPLVGITLSKVGITVTPCGYKSGHHVHNMLTCWQARIVNANPDGVLSVAFMLYSFLTLPLETFKP